MNGLLQGFQAGYGMMDNYYDKKDRKEFRDQSYADQQARILKQDERQSRLDKMGENEHVFRMTGLAQRNQLNQKNIDNYDEDRKLDVQSKQLGLQSQKNNNTLNQQRINQNNDNQKKAKQGELFTELMNMVEGHRRGMNIDFDRAYNISRGLQGSQYGFLSSDLQQRTIIKLNQDLQQGRISEETLKLMNAGGIPEIKAAIGKPSRFGAPIKDVVVTNILPDPKNPENFQMALLVTDEEGNTYSSAVNEDRDANSAIKSINSDKIFKHFASQQYVLDEAQKSGFLDSLSQHAKMQQSATGRKPSAIQTIEFIESKYGPEAAQVYALRGKVDPRKYQASLFKTAEKIVSQDPNFMQMPEDERLRTVQETATKIDAMFEQMQGQNSQQSPIENNSEAQQQALERLSSLYRSEN